MFAAGRIEDRGHGRLHGQQVGRRALRTGPQPMVQPAADQQQEQQRNGGVEIGVASVQQGLLEADQQGQDDAQ
jgi:hypothetical protein